MKERREPRPGSIALGLLGLGAAWGCGDASTEAPPALAEPAASDLPPGPDLSPGTARMDQVAEFQADLAAERHPGDGGGTARLTEATPDVRAGSAASFTIQLEVGPLGIEPGGVVTFMPEPFWGWSTPQTSRPDLPGFTEVRLAEGCEATLSAATFGGAEAGMLVLTVEGAALDPGTLVTLRYGAGDMQARADRYAGRGARLWLGVDADGDGVRSLVDSSPRVDVAAREPERLVLLGPSVARPGEVVRYSVSLLDAWANAEPTLTDGSAWTPEVRIDGYPEGWEGPSTVALPVRGTATFEVTVGSGAPSPAAARLRAVAPLPGENTASSTSNPLWVDEEIERIFWADLHGHTGLSDGTGEVVDYFRYARDIGRLDIVALTDHDHFGMRFLDASPEGWQSIEEATAAFHDPPRFVTVLGYEWTSWIHGHRHVLYFDGVGEVLSSITPAGAQAYDTPAKLWAALRGRDALTVAHHSSGHPIPVNWTFSPDPLLEPVTEIVSVHGSSEARDAPHVVAGSRDGQFVRDQLNRGLRLGFIGSGDSHDGHPGLPHLSPGYGWRPATAAHPERMGTGGLAAVRAAELSRPAVLAALRARATYATSGPRMAVRHTRGAQGIELHAAGTAPLRSVKLIAAAEGRTDRSVASRRELLPETGSRPLETIIRIPARELEDRAYAYVRLVQVDGGTAWYGPFFPE